MLQSQFTKIIEGIKKLDTIVSVAWDEIIDDPHKCCWVRFEDVTGYVLKIPCNDWGNDNTEFTLINLALMKLWNQIGENPNGYLILTDADFQSIVNEARHKKPYTGEKIVNKAMYEIGYQAPETVY